MSTSFIFLVKSFLGNFYRRSAIFFWSHWSRYESQIEASQGSIPSDGNSYHLKGTKYSIRYFLRKKDNKTNNYFDLFGSKDPFKLSSIPYGNNLPLYLLSLQKFSGSYCCTKCEKAFLSFMTDLYFPQSPTEAICRYIYNREI